MIRVYEFYAAMRTDQENAELVRDAMQAAATAVTTPDLTTEKDWLILVAAEALARAAMDKRRGEDPIANAAAEMEHEPAHP